MQLKLNTTPNLILLLLAPCLLWLSCGDSPNKVPEQYHDFCARIHRDNSTSISAELASIDSLMKSKTGVLVLEDGGRSMIARAWLSEYAEKTIDVQYFIFSTDNVGLIACDYLVRAADRGVKVRILVDDITVEAGAHEILTLDSHPNIEIKIYNPGVNLGKNIFQRLSRFATHFDKANQRMHNKTFTVDGKVVITGGRNIADEYFDYDHEYNFRDRDVLLMGKKVQEVQSSFNTFWNHELSVPVANILEEPGTDFSDPKRFDRLHQYACNPDNFWPQVREQIQQIPQTFRAVLASGDLVWTDSLQFVSDVPGKTTGDGNASFSNTTRALLELVMNAKHSITIQSPYLITTAVGQQVFADAIKRGVKIKILTNSLSSTDNHEAFSGYQRCRKDLLKAGVSIFEFRPDAKERYRIMTGALQGKINYCPIFGLHAKSMVVDDHITVIGTFNLDPRSAYRNSECLTIMRSQKIAKTVLDGIEQECLPENSWETTLQWNPDHLASTTKQITAASRRVVPKGIL